MRKKLVFILCLTSILIAGCTNTLSTPSNQQETQITKKLATNDSVTNSSQSLTTPKNTPIPIELLTETKYLDYTPELYNSLLGNKSFALFFHADWCATCRKIETEVTQNLDKLKLGTVILKVNYDKEIELRKKYGINSQSSFVIIDKNGATLEKIVAPTNEKLQKKKY